MKITDRQWHKVNREADATLVVIDKAGVSGQRHCLSSILASYDTTASSELNIAGAYFGDGVTSGAYGLNFTSSAVLNLTSNLITSSGHGFSNGDKVLLNMNGGTAPTNTVAYTSDEPGRAKRGREAPG